MENEEDELNKLRIENEIKKMKLSLEHGTSFFSPSVKKIIARTGRSVAGSDTEV